jgi:hypothetical protein
VAVAELNLGLKTAKRQCGVKLKNDNNNNDYKKRKKKKRIENILLKRSVNL